MLSTSLTFVRGSADGAEMCTHVTILPDIKGRGVLVTLALVTAQDSLTVHNRTATITIDGKSKGR